MPQQFVKRQYRKTGGLDAVSSEIGAEIYAKTCLRDDGVKGFGGGRIACIGAMRQGKTTLGILTLPMMHFIGEMPKENFLRDSNRDLTKMVQETIIYRGRKLDYWNCYTKQHYGKCFPNAKPRELRIFIYEKDDISFFEESQGENVMLPIKGLDIYKYKDQEDLYLNLIEGGINVVYVPNEYQLSPLLKKVLNEMRMLQPEDPEWYNDSDMVAVISETFWYDLFYYMQEVENSTENYKAEKPKRRLKSVTFFFDEAHQIFPANEPKPFWYLIDNFAENALIDSGRMNMTIYANIHALNLMYWKVLQRFETFIWLGGSKPDKSYSMMTDKLTRKLSKGVFIIEEKMVRFGKMFFGRIPNQPYTVLAKGAA